jgi:hypothetical protein
MGGEIGGWRALGLLNSPGSWREFRVAIIFCANFKWRGCVVRAEKRGQWPAVGSQVNEGIGRGKLEVGELWDC